MTTVLACLLLLLTLTDTAAGIRFGNGFLGARDAMKEIHTGGSGRSEARTCYRREFSQSSFSSVTTEDNAFLELIDYIEYIQMSDVKVTSDKVSDAMAYYNVSSAALDYGSYVNAQQSLARAFNVLQSTQNTADRFKRSASTASTKVLTPKNLFDTMKREQGEDQFRKFLKLDKEVWIGLVIDTSLSMTNDIAAVKAFIRELVSEQQATGQRAVYTINTYADRIYETRSFRSNDVDAMFEFLNNMEPRLGGDCAEKTCGAIIGQLYGAKYGADIRNGAIYVFTDASSKDCDGMSRYIISLFQATKITPNFVLFGSCRKEVDVFYVKIASHCNGFCLMITDTGVFNITDTTNGAFESDSVIMRGSTYYSENESGQGYHSSHIRRRRAALTWSGANSPPVGEEETVVELIPIDELMDEFKVLVTISPSGLAPRVSLEKPLDGDSTVCRNSRISRSAGSEGSIVFDVRTEDCTCTGAWRLTLPTAGVYNYVVKSIGERTLNFDAYFVDNQVAGKQISSYSPCVGIRETLVIKVQQVEHVIGDSLEVELITGDGIVFLSERLRQMDWYPNMFVLDVEIPEETAYSGFRVVLKGQVLRGSGFRRTSRYQFFPTTSCLRTVDVTNHYALVGGLKSLIKLVVSNLNSYEERYVVFCTNSMDYPTTVVTPKRTLGGRRFIRSNPFLLRPGEAAEVVVVILSPPPQYIRNGRSVSVMCEMLTTTNEKISETILLTEMETLPI